MYEYVINYDGVAESFIKSVADPEGGHGVMARTLSLEVALSVPEGTLRVPEGIVCRLQQVLW